MLRIENLHIIDNNTIFYDDIENLKERLNFAYQDMEE